MCWRKEVGEDGRVFLTHAPCDDGRGSRKGEGTEMQGCISLGIVARPTPAACDGGRESKNGEVTEM